MYLGDGVFRVFWGIRGFRHLEYLGYLGYVSYIGCWVLKVFNPRVFKVYLEHEGFSGYLGLRVFTVCRIEGI